jgi:hypothetical protein
MAGPRLAKNMGLLHLRTSAKLVASSLRWARSQALSTGKVYNAIFDCGGQRLIISDYAGARSADPLQQLRAQAGLLTEADRQLLNEQLQEEEPQKPVLKTYELPEEVSFSRIEIGELRDADPGERGIYQLSFFPDGTSIGGAIEVADEQRRSCAITVDFLTGIVSVEESED